jgi:superfamily II DNA or RNA helicase
MPPVPSQKQARLRFARGTLVLEANVQGARLAVDEAHALVWDSRSNAWRGDGMAYRSLRKQLLISGYRLEDSVPQWRALTWPKVNLPPLRAEQKQAVAAWDRTRCGVIVMPTGTGKTEVALAIMRQTAVSTLVVAPVRDLMYQWHRRIKDGLDVDAGVIGDGIFQMEPVSVTTYDSACIHMDKLGDKFGLIVFDECHHLPGPMRRDAARMSAAPWRLGLTATPERADGKHADLDELIGPQVYQLAIASVRGNVLADYDVRRIPVHLSPEEQGLYNHLSHRVRRYIWQQRQIDPAFSWEAFRVRACRDPEAHQALRAFHKKKAIEDRATEKLRVLEDLFRLHAGSPCLIFTGSNAMARDVSRRFLIPCLLSHSRKAERLEVLQGLGDGIYPALVANQVLDEGVDLPEVKVAVVIGGSGSSKQAKQRLGRVLRRAGNARAVLYEVVCADTNDERRSRRRRKSDAYESTRHCRL